MPSLRLPFFLSLLASAAAGAAEPAVQFNRDIRPILAENCFYCHGPDPGTRKASLRLDREEGFFGQRDEGPVVVKGKPEESPLYQRLVSKDKEEMMPPPKSHHVLKPAQVEALRGWIAGGAPWQPHWALVKPQRPVAPETKKAGWTRNPIDGFTLARMEGAGLAPADEADRRTIARRVSLDLTGLPPEPVLVEQFVADQAPDAYEKLVDLLMSSPRYGEHRARYWLDAARYADTHGLHIDNYREIWAYRDWVIDALNTNMPFDRFTIEQLAGDLLPNPTESQLIATGFHRCNITTAEGGTIPEENLANYARDRVETTSWVWLGLTANCAVCHDHKFDPISTKDFYAMSAFFRNTTQDHTDKNVKDPAPVLVLPSAADRPRWEALSKESTAANEAVAARRKALEPEFEKWVPGVSEDALEARLPAATVALPLDEGAGQEVYGRWNGAEQTVAVGHDLTWSAGKHGPALVLSKESTLNLGDQAGFERDQPFSVSLWVNLPKANQSGSMVARMDDAKGDRGWALNTRGSEVLVYLISQWPGDAIELTTTGNALKRDDWRHIAFTYDGSGTAAGVHVYVNGVDAKLKVEKTTLRGSLRGETPLRVGQRSQSEHFAGALQDLRIFDRELSPLEATALLRVGDLAAPKAPKAQLAELYAAGDAECAAASLRTAHVEAERRSIEGRSPVTLIQQEKAGVKPIAHVLFRGQYDQPREEVAAAVLTSLHPMPKEAPANRLGLAEWIVDAENPLTARVTVNRLWQEIFGTGLVKSAEDFGIMSEPPSHPELLDWLAVEFRESGWDMKHMVRLMVTSATYRQSARMTPEKIERDPANRLLARGPRFRMDAEMIRDTALAASGALSGKIGGPSVKPYQPEGVWEAVAMPGSNTSRYSRDAGEALYRRSLYSFWKRTAPPPAMEVFNAPTRETACLRRDRSNTPLQALVTMNDPQFMEAARLLAERALKAAPAEPLAHIAPRLLARSLRPEELAVVQKSQAELAEYYEAHPEEAKALLTVGEAKSDPALPAPLLAAWTMTCNELMNLDEVLCK